MAARQEIRPLTGIRGIAALMVVALHIAVTLSALQFYETFPTALVRLLSFGTFAVDIFFMLSGYVIMLSFNGSRGDFAVHRIARIFPLHIVLLTVIVAVNFLINAHGIHTTLDYRILPFAYLLLTAWFQLNGDWNLPTWSLSAELFAYSLFYLFNKPLLRLAQAGFAVLLALALCLEMPALAGTALPRACAGFFVGICLQRLTVPPRTVLLTDAAAAAMGVSLWFGWPAAVFPAALLVKCLSMPGRSLCHRALSSQLCLWLGNISYSVYLLHAPLLYFSALLLRAWLHPTGLVAALAFAAASFATVLAIAPLTYQMIERPARDWINQAWREHRKKAVSKAFFL